jgi:site-specific DNA-methyltransferase (adenine-specific)
MPPDTHSAGSVSGSWEVVPGDCLEVMAGMPDGSIDAIVTSPPYADQRDYVKAAAGVEGRNGAAAKHTHPRTRNTSRNGRDEAPWQFVEEFEPVLRELLRVCSPTGSLMLNLGVIMRNGEEHGYADELLRRARAMGWKLLHRMVWHKPNSIPLSHPSYLHIKHEWIFWLAPTTGAYRGYDRDTRVPHSETSLKRVQGSYKGRADLHSRKDQRYHKRGVANPLHPDGAKPATIITVAVGGQSVNHPAIMALDLALYLVSLSCPPGGRVLDPYSGSGTTGVAALRRGRGYIGIELEPAYVELSRERIRADAPLLNTAAELVPETEREAVDAA